VIPSQSGIRTALKIRDLAKDTRIRRISFVGNLVRDEEDRQFLIKGLGEEPLVCFPDSATIRRTERTGQPITAALPAVAEVTRGLIDKLSSL